MTDTYSPASKDDWKARIGPYLSQSLQKVSEQITRTEGVQSWLHDASMEAADGLGHMSGMQGEMEGYVRMMDDLEVALPDLLAAVDDLTMGCGTLDLHWRPLQPNFSRLYVDFGQDYSVTLFVPLADCSRATAREAITTVEDALPQGRPFRNRPNSVTGYVGRNGIGIGVRVKEHLRDDGDGTYRSLTLLPADDGPLDGLTESEAERQLLSHLCADDSAP